MPLTMAEMDSDDRHSPAMALKRRRPRRPSRLRRVAGWLAAAGLSLAACSVLLVLVLRFVAPPVTAFMLADQLDAWRSGARSHRIEYRWQPMEAIAPGLPLAIIAAEDQHFPQHRGFDVDSIRSAVREAGQRGQLRGASTLTQQVARNLFLWRGRSWLRKGLEAWFTVWIEILWPKTRILEMYCNIAEFGPGIYGAEAAAQRYFGRPALALSGRQAALMATVLPAPRHRRPDQPGPWMVQRAVWIERQIRQLGGESWLPQ